VPFALQAHGVSVTYDGALALRAGQLQLAEGAIVTVVGRNGAGKSTLLAALSGLIPAAGSLTLFGSDITRMNIEERVALGLCLVPERRELFGEMSVADNLELGSFTRWQRGESDIDATRAWVFELFPRLRERLRQKARLLSGGERQMLALGRALMARPRVLMLDEPSLGLAPVIVRDMFRIIVALKQRGVSILLVEQNVRAALAIADYGYVIENGEIAAEGAAEVLQQDALIVDAYLGRGAALGGGNSTGDPKWLS
jgi:branched-chain amino acid transport system ATP-binding protein